MSEITLAAESTTLVLNGRAYEDVVDGDTLTLTPVNPTTEQTTSKKGVNIQGRSDKDVMDLVVRVAKYSDDDNALNTARNATPPTVLAGTCKETYLKDGTEITTTYVLEQGSLTTPPSDTRNNQTGNNMLEYTIRFNKGVRV